MMTLWFSLKSSTKPIAHGIDTNNGNCHAFAYFGPIKRNMFCQMYLVEEVSSPHMCGLLAPFASSVPPN